MPIQLTCPCGKRLQVADEFAGKPGQCPACGGILPIPRRDAPVTASSPESAPAGGADPGQDGLFSQGLLECAPTPPAEVVADLPETEKGGVRKGDNEKLTAVGCVLTLLTVAVIFGVAIRIVRWRDPATGQPLPRIVAIFSPLLIGAALNGIVTLLLRAIGVRVLSKQEKDADD